MEILNAIARLSEEHWRQLADSLIGLCLLVGTYAAYRTKRWLLELADRERERCERLLSEAHEREVKRSNETLKRFTEALMPAEQPSLGDWLANAERNWQLEQDEPSEPRRPAHERSESGLHKLDWTDDEDKTRPETPESRAARKPPSDWPNAD